MGKKWRNGTPVKSMQSSETSWKTGAVTLRMLMRSIVDALRNIRIWVAIWKLTSDQYTNHLRNVRGGQETNMTFQCGQQLRLYPANESIGTVKSHCCSNSVWTSGIVRLDFYAIVTLDSAVLVFQCIFLRTEALFTVFRYYLLPETWEWVSQVHDFSI